MIYWLILLTCNNQGCLSHPIQTYWHEEDCRMVAKKIEKADDTIRAMCKQESIK